MVKPAYSSLFKALQESGLVDSHRSLNGSLLLALDGTEYFSSNCLHCDQCLTRHHANGTVTYFHSVVTPVLVKPGCDKVIPLAPEFVTPQDGAEKQDCEIKCRQALAGGARRGIRAAEHDRPRRRLFYKCALPCCNAAIYFLITY